MTLTQKAMEDLKVKILAKALSPLLPYRQEDYYPAAVQRITRVFHNAGHDQALNLAETIAAEFENVVLLRKANDIRSTMETARD